MKQPSILSVTKQAAELIRQGIDEGRWQEVLPGRLKLARELGVSPATASRAIESLVQEGVLESRGANRSCGIPGGGKAKHSGALRVRFLPHTSDDQTSDCWVASQYELRLLGMKIESCSFTLEDLKYELSALQRRAKGLGADAWVIQGGNKETLRWFSEQPIPAFAFGGGMLGIDIAGTGFDPREGVRTVTRRLIQLGHTRIVFLGIAPVIQNLQSGPAGYFVEEMKAHGIPVGSYNLATLPEHCSTTELRNTLANLFRLTSPTALLVDHPAVYHITKDFLWESGKRFPRDCSLVCLSHTPGFEFGHPAPTHLKADVMLLVDPLVRWARALERGNPNRQQTLIPFTLINGETIGPVPSH